MRQNYVLVTRLSDGTLLTLHHVTGWNRHDPERRTDPAYVPARGFRLTVHDSPDVLRAGFSEDWDERGLIEMDSIQVSGWKLGDWKWRAFNEFKRSRKGIRRYRGRESHYEDVPMSASDIALCRFVEPRFGEFSDLLQRACRYLLNEGFGTLPQTSPK